MAEIQTNKMISKKLIKDLKIMVNIKTKNNKIFWLIFLKTLENKQKQKTN